MVIAEDVEEEFEGCRLDPCVQSELKGSKESKPSTWIPIPDATSAPMMPMPTAARELEGGGGGGGACKSSEVEESELPPRKPSPASDEEEMDVDVGDEDEDEVTGRVTSPFQWSLPNLNVSGTLATSGFEKMPREAVFPSDEDADEEVDPMGRPKRDESELGRNQ